MPDNWMIVLIIAASIIIALLAVCFVLFYFYRKGKKVNKDKVTLINGVRCTSGSDTLKGGGDVNVSVNDGDIILERGVTMVSKKETRLPPGKYTVLSAQQSDNKFNLRKGGFVREFAHGDGIALAEGEEICAVSHTVILR